MRPRDFKALALLIFPAFTACSTIPYQESSIYLPEAKLTGVNGLLLALVEPLRANPPCRGDVILVSLPDEILCEEDKGNVFKPSPIILPPAELLLVSLRYAGFSVSIVPSLAEAKGARVGVLPVLLQADAMVTDPRDFYLEQTSFFQRLRDGYLLSGEPTDGKQTKVIANVKLRFTIVDMATRRVLWEGPLRQSAENLVPIPPLNKGKVQIEAGAGVGEFEPQAYAMRSLVVQAYIQLGQDLARLIQDLVRRRDQDGTTLDYHNHNNDTNTGWVREH